MTSLKLSLVPRRSTAKTRIVLLGGPWDQRSYRYPQPLPDILVMCDSSNQRFVYHDYRRDGETYTYRHTGDGK